MSEYNQKPWYLKESEVGPEKAKPLWCDECHYYHDKPSDCEYVTPQPVAVYYDPSVTNAPQ